MATVGKFPTTAVTIFFLNEEWYNIDNKLGGRMKKAAFLFRQCLVCSFYL
jgi:hypothetical protein